MPTPKNYLVVLNPTIRTFLHKQDIFGYPIPINFNGYRSFHNTSIGGVFSILIKILYFCFFMYLMIKMFQYDDYKTYQNEIDISEEDKFKNGINITDLGM